MISKKSQRDKRHFRIRVKIKGVAQMPRLAVFRSNKHIYAQVIDDEKSQTLVSASDFNLDESKDKISKTVNAQMVGEILADKAKVAKISKVVFDRSGFKFHGRVKALAEGARKGGLKF